MMTDATGPLLNSDELAELDSFFLTRADEDEAFLIDEAHGYYTAMVLAGLPVEGEAVQNMVMGENPFTDEFEEQRITELLSRMHDEIRQALRARKAFEPLVIESIDEQGQVTESYEGWCYGFMAAVTEYHQQWSELPKHEADLLTPIATLALLASDEEMDMDEDECESWIEMIPGSVSGLFAHFQRQVAA